MQTSINQNKCIFKEVDLRERFIYDKSCLVK